MKKLLIVSALATLTTTQANAVSYGTDVNEKDYRDYTVRFLVEAIDHRDDIFQASCGGLLVSGEYIISAAHCFAKFENVSWQWFTDNGASNDITIYQGIDLLSDQKTSTTYEVVNFYDKETIKAEAVEERKRIEELYPYIINKAMSPERLYPKEDIVVIKLSKTVMHHDNAALLPSYDQENNKALLNSGDELTFRGWGVDEYFQYSEKMQETTLVYTPENGMEYTPGLPRLTKIFPDNPIRNKVVCGEDTIMIANCAYTLSDLITLTPKNQGGNVRSGDSGTPIEVKPNHVFGLSKARQFFDGVETATVTHFTWYLKSIAETLNIVTSPTNIILHEKDAEKGETHTFAVQNLTNHNETLNPYLANANGAFSLSGCEQTTLEPLAHCEITVSATPNAEETDALLYLADTRDTRIPLSYDIAGSSTGGGDDDTGGGDDDTGGGDDDTGGGDGNYTTPTTGGGGGGGGSLGWLSLLALFGMSVKRRYSRH